MFSVAWWKSRLYPQPEAYDMVRAFLQTLEQLLQPHHAVLDIGAGAGELNRYSLRGKVQHLVGVDLDPRVVRNPLLDRGVLGSAYNLPFEKESFDIAFAIYVLEHIEDPPRFVREVHRVLKPGGAFVCLTPNRFHYVPLVASCTSHRFHQWYNRWRGRDADDTFPTHYRMNTRATLRRQFHAAGFERCEFTLIEAMPNYLEFSVPSYLAGAAYERLVNRSAWLECLRVNLIGRFYKPAFGVVSPLCRAA